MKLLAVLALCCSLAAVARAHIHSQKVRHIESLRERQADLEHLDMCARLLGPGRRVWRIPSGSQQVREAGQRL